MEAEVQDEVGRPDEGDDVAGGRTRSLTAYSVAGKPFKIVRASRKRLWMDLTEQAYAYRCLPLVMANQLGWEILCPADFTAIWTGGATKDDIKITFYSEQDPGIVSHFGGGIISFNVGWLFRTDPDQGLLCLGPANQPRPTIVALEGVIESNWSCYTFTMNWKFTAPGEVLFKREDPICRIVPFDLRSLDFVDPVLRDIDDLPDDERKQYEEWTKSRAAFQRSLTDREPAAVKQGWQKHYMLGLRFLPDQTREPTHQTKFCHREFTDLRKSQSNQRSGQ